MAPIFVLIEVLMKMGHLRDFKAAAQPEVEARIAAFKAGASKAAGPPSSSGGGSDRGKKAKAT